MTASGSILPLFYHCLWFIIYSVLSLPLTSSVSSFALFYHCLWFIAFITASGSSFALFYHCLSLPLVHHLLCFITIHFLWLFTSSVLSLPLVHTSSGSTLLCLITASGSSFTLFYHCLSLPLFHYLLLFSLFRSLQVQIRRRR